MQQTDTLKDLHMHDNIQDYSINHHTNKVTDSPVNQPFFFSNIHLFICTKGNARISINMKEYLITENSIGAIVPGLIVIILERSEDFHLHSLLFTLDFMTSFPPSKDFVFVKDGNISPIIQLRNEHTLHLLRYFDLLEAQSGRRNFLYSNNIAKGLIYSLLSEFMSIYHEHKDVSNNQKTSRQEEIIDQFFKLLKENCKQERNVEFYADKMCLTPKYLSSLIKRVTGKSVFEWINTTSIILAKILLKTKEQSISQIAEELNFPNPSFFCRFFKKHTGMTPNEYRKS